MRNLIGELHIDPRATVSGSRNDSRYDFVPEQIITDHAHIGSHSSMRGMRLALANAFGPRGYYISSEINPATGGVLVYRYTRPTQDD